MVNQGEMQEIETISVAETLPSVQPGGGAVMHLELIWGRVRRWYLRKFRPRYVARMQALRQGRCPDCPHHVIDPRDLKYFRNVCGFSFPPEANRFAWRGRLAVAQLGLAEIVVFACPLLAAAFLCAFWVPVAAILPGSLAVFVLAFFRDPDRRVPQGPGVIVAPADGKVDDIEQIEHCELLGGPAVKIGIFLSVFNVHVNRVPEAARVLGLRYLPGRFGNAMSCESAAQNEQLWVLLEGQQPPHRRTLVKQIAGAIARRIVCELRPGERVSRGQKFGMIKFGSRTELYLPKEDGLCIEVKTNQKTRGGSSIVARYGDGQQVP